MPAPALSVSIVTYRTATGTLATALASLAHAAQVARAARLLGTVEVHVVDNSPPADLGAAAAALPAWPEKAGEIALHAGHGNVGYGRANNLVLPRLASDLHLVMNPDVELAREALAAALEVLRDRPEVGLAAPAVYGDAGELQYLCKRYPSVWVLFLRGFAPGFLRRRHAAAVEAYEMRDVIAPASARGETVDGVPLASGCFMLLRTRLFAKLGGFDPRFFMYFEDYDLSLRLAREARLAYVPQARIVHHGGEAARKGWRHVGWFVASAWRFFARHGWKIA